MTKPDKLSIEEAEKIAVTRCDDASRIARQLADVMRENVRLRTLLRDALDAISIERIRDDLITDEQLGFSTKAYDDCVNELQQHKHSLPVEEIAGFDDVPVKHSDHIADAGKLIQDPTKQSESRDFSALHSTPEKQVTYTGELKPENVTMTVAQTKTSGDNGS